MKLDMTIAIVLVEYRIVSTIGSYSREDLIAFIVYSSNVLVFLQI